MKNDILYYSVGALLYCPASKTSIADSVICEHLGKNYSLALCLEDTIQDSYVAEAERILTESVFKIYHHHQTENFYLPKIFIRVRYPGQIRNLVTAFGPAISIITGFIIPKFSSENQASYIAEIIKANELCNKTLYVMPIYESNTIIDLRKRREILYELKDSLSKIEDLVLNIRIGGNDLCHAFGFRRPSDESIHRITPISNIFADLVTIYGMDYVISGPVWEYYSGDHWKEGLQQEIRDDKLCGFTGKTVIHPNQISVVNDAYKVSSTDFQDACEILNWNEHSSCLVSGSGTRERMNEYKTHTNWARQILYLSQTFGVRQ